MLTRPRSAVVWISNIGARELGPVGCWRGCPCVHRGRIRQTSSWSRATTGPGGATRPGCGEALPGGRRASGAGQVEQVGAFALVEPRGLRDQPVLTPATTATSSRRSPGTRRRPLAGRHTGRVVVQHRVDGLPAGPASSGARSHRSSPLALLARYDASGVLSLYFVDSRYHDCVSWPHPNLPGRPAHRPVDDSATS